MTILAWFYLNQVCSQRQIFILFVATSLLIRTVLHPCAEDRNILIVTAVQYRCEILHHWFYACQIYVCFSLSVTYFSTPGFVFLQMSKQPTTFVSRRHAHMQVSYLEARTTLHRRYGSS